MSNDTPPTLPAGHVLLGRGGTFKKTGNFEGYGTSTLMPDPLGIPGWKYSDNWGGDDKTRWYAVPIGSPVALLNAPPTPPAGHVLLGRGGTFKTDGFFRGYAFDSDDGWMADSEWTGNETDYWYAAPIGSPVALLNDLGPKPADPLTLLEAKNKEITHLNKVLARKNRKIKSLNAALRERVTSSAPEPEDDDPRYVMTNDPNDPRQWRLTRDKIEFRESECRPWVAAVHSLRLGHFFNTEGELFSTLRFIPAP